MSQQGISCKDDGLGDGLARLSGQPSVEAGLVWETTGNGPGGSNVRISGSSSTGGAWLTRTTLGGSHLVAVGPSRTAIWRPFFREYYPSQPTKSMATTSDDNAPSDTSHYVYIVECSDGTYYTGYTTDVERRIEEHNDGSGAKYTRGRQPVTLVHVESFTTSSAALQREHAIKQLRRSRKERLVQEGS